MQSLIKPTSPAAAWLGPILLAGLLHAPAASAALTVSNGYHFLDNRSDNSVRILAGVAVLVASINIFGGFAVTRRMLRMFSKN